jgi:hypothetical protein
MQKQPVLIQFVEWHVNLDKSERAVGKRRAQIIDTGASGDPVRHAAL